MRPCTVIARIPHRGCVRVCPSGCVHVTYAGVTFDFTPKGFGEFVAALGRLPVRPDAGEVEVECFHLRMRFTRAEYAEFTRLVGEGKRRLDAGDTGSMPEEETPDTAAERRYTTLSLFIPCSEMNSLN